MYQTNSDAAHAMVKECFSLIPLDLIERAYFGDNYTGEFENITPYTEDELEGNYATYGLPMWDTLFLVNDTWIESRIKYDLNGIKALGFLIYSDEKDRIYLGIDGCGYNFYTEHWIPLYNWLGFHWHSEEEAAG